MLSAGNRPKAVRCEHWRHVCRYIVLYAGQTYFTFKINVGVMRGARKLSLMCSESLSCEISVAK